MNSFFKEVIASLLKQADEAFSGHATFRVADPKAVGENPIREYSLDAVPLDGDQVMVTLSMDGSEKAFEKTVSSDEAKHIFTLISSDLAEAVSFTAEQKYDEAKETVKKILKNYAESTDTPVETNLPKLHNTQASENFDGLWKIAKASIRNTFQTITFDSSEELMDYQEKQKGAQGGSNQDHIPLWDKTKGDKKAPGAKDQLAPPSMSYEDVENAKEKDHDDMQKHIDEKIKTELESALQEKAASVFGPAQVELVKVLRAPGNGRNWDEIKKMFVKDFGFDKDSTNIFIDEQRESMDPTGIDVKPEEKEDVNVDVKEKSPLTPPEELVSPDTHEKLLKDHEDKKKDNSPVKEKSDTFIPKDVMNISEDEETQDESSLANEIARADNSDIHKVAAGDLNPLQEPLQEKPTTPSQDTVPMNKPLDHDAPQKGDRVFVSADLTSEKSGFEGTFISTYKSKGTDFSIVETDQGDLLDVESHRVVKTSEGSSGAQDVEPVAEPIIEMPKDDEIQVTPKMDDFHTSSLKQADASSPSAIADEKARERVKQIFDSTGRKVSGDEFRTMFEEEYKKLEASQSEFLTIKAEAEALLQEIDGMGKTSYKFVKKGLEKHASDSAFEGNGWCRVWVTDDEVAADAKYAEALKLPDETARIEALKEIARNIAHEALRLADDSGAKVGVQSWFDSLSPSDHDRIDWVALANPVNEEEEDAKFEQGMADKYGPDAVLPEFRDQIIPKSSLEPKVEKVAAGASACIKCNKVFPLDQMIKNVHGAGYLCKEHAKNWNADTKTLEQWKKKNASADGKVIHDVKWYQCSTCPEKFDSYEKLKEHEKLSPPKKKNASDFEKGISQNKTADEPEVAPKTQFKQYKITPKYTPKEEAIPAAPELDAVLSKMDALQQNLATLEAARKQIAAKMKQEMDKIDQSGERVQMEAQLQEAIEKAGILIEATESKVVQWKDKLYTMQNEEVSYVPKLTPKEMLEKIYVKFSGAEKYVQDVLNGMLSQAKTIVEKTLIQWPNKKSSVTKEANILDDMNHYNDELMAALKELSSPL